MSLFRIDRERGTEIVRSDKNFKKILTIVQIYAEKDSGHIIKCAQKYRLKKFMEKIRKGCGMSVMEK